MPLTQSTRKASLLLKTKVSERGAQRTWRGGKVGEITSQNSFLITASQKAAERRVSSGAEIKQTVRKLGETNYRSKRGVKFRGFWSIRAQESAQNGILREVFRSVHEFSHGLQTVRKLCCPSMSVTGRRAAAHFRELVAGIARIVPDGASERHSSPDWARSRAVFTPRRPPSASPCR